MMDAAEIARLPRERSLPDLLRDWAKLLDIPSGRFVNEDLEAAADALEQARNDAEQRMRFLADAVSQRDAAQQSAEAARALLVEAGIVLKVERVTHPVRARIEAFLEPKV